MHAQAKKQRRQQLSGIQLESEALQINQDRKGDLLRPNNISPNEIAVNIASGGIVIAEARKRLCLPNSLTKSPKISKDPAKTSAQTHLQINGFQQPTLPGISRQSAVYFAWYISPDLAAASRLSCRALRHYHCHRRRLRSRLLREYRWTARG